MRLMNLKLAMSFGSTQEGRPQEMVEIDGMYWIGSRRRSKASCI